MEIVEATTVSKKAATADSEKKPGLGRSRKGCMKGKGGPENASCKYKGVRQRTWGKWVAEIREPNCGARLWLGTFNTSLEAAMAYDEASRKLYGSSAKINLPYLYPNTATAATSTNTTTTNTTTTSLSATKSFTPEELIFPSQLKTEQSLEFPKLNEADSSSMSCGYYWYGESSSSLSGCGWADGEDNNNDNLYWPELYEQNNFLEVEDIGISMNGLMMDGGGSGGSEDCKEWDGLQVPWNYS